MRFPLTQPILDRLQAVTKESYRGPGTCGQTYLRSSTSASRSSSSSCSCWATKLSTVDEAICSAVQSLTDASCPASLVQWDPCSCRTVFPTGPESAKGPALPARVRIPGRPVSCAPRQARDCSRIPVSLLQGFPTELVR